MTLREKFWWFHTCGREELTRKQSRKLKRMKREVRWAWRLAPQKTERQLRIEAIRRANRKPLDINAIGAVFGAYIPHIERALLARTRL